MLLFTTKQFSLQSTFWRDCLGSLAAALSHHQTHKELEKFSSNLCETQYIFSDELQRYHSHLIWMKQDHGFILCQKGTSVSHFYLASCLFPMYSFSKRQPDTKCVCMWVCVKVRNNQYQLPHTKQLYDTQQCLLFAWVVLGVTTRQYVFISLTK